jgi:hypothetical protein
LFHYPIGKSKATGGVFYRVAEALGREGFTYVGVVVAVLLDESSKAHYTLCSVKMIWLLVLLSMDESST